MVIQKLAAQPTIHIRSIQWIMLAILDIYPAEFHAGTWIHFGYTYFRFDYTTRRLYRVLYNNEYALLLLLFFARSRSE